MISKNNAAAPRAARQQQYIYIKYLAYNNNNMYDMYDTGRTKDCSLLLMPAGKERTPQTHLLYVRFGGNGHKNL